MLWLSAPVLVARLPVWTLSARAYPRPAPASRPRLPRRVVRVQALHEYTGPTHAVDPVLVSLLKGLAPGQAPVVRIGGDSATGPGGRSAASPARRGPLRAHPRWLRRAQARPRTERQLILGINLEAERPALAAAEARALVQGIGRRTSGAFEIGNEPDLSACSLVPDRTASSPPAGPYGLSDYIRIPPLAPDAAPRCRWPAGVRRPRLDGTGPVHLLEPRLTWSPPPLSAAGLPHRPEPSRYPSIPNLLADCSSAAWPRCWPLRASRPPPSASLPVTR